jgi:CRISPR-associated protein Csh1
MTKNKEKDPDIKIENIFDFERIIVRDLFNNSLIRIKEDSYTLNYFGDVDPRYISGGETMSLLILKYRKAFYDYIYKSRTNAISVVMFDDIMYNSILSNIQSEKIEKRCEWNNHIKVKINIWFSLYNTFNNNKNTEIMASKITDLLSKMRCVSKGETTLETPAEFAFGAGQIVSYLIDRSVASDKTYTLLEPFLQKAKSNLLQDAIANTFAVYKHDIKVYKGAFQALSSNVLTFDDNVDMKPLLKYFLAGCFSPCVIYDKKENNND